MRVVSSVVEALGLLAVVAGVALFDLRAALVVAGVVLVLAGMALDPGRSR
jgi:hypothetical protein